MQRKKILFICTHNSARSQIAEGLTNADFGKDWKAFSAGTVKTSVHPLAIEVMKEIGIDISNHTSKSIEQFVNEKFNLVITVCDSAQETCPFFPNAETMIHAGFHDPSQIKGKQDVKLIAFRKTRDEINDWLISELKNN